MIVVWRKTHKRALFRLVETLTTAYRVSSSKARNPAVRSSYNFLNLATSAASPSAGSSNFWDLLFPLTHNFSSTHISLELYDDWFIEVCLPLTVEKISQTMLDESVSNLLTIHSSCSFNRLLYHPTTFWDQVTILLRKPLYHKKYPLHKAS